jgi:hypothetical protein
VLTDSSAGPSAELELVNYGAGYAWLRPEPEPEPDDDPRYTLTQRGRDLLARERAMAELFDPGWPTVAEACALGWVA